MAEKNEVGLMIVKNIKVCWKAKAIEHNEKFLELWKDADPDIAEAEDAKKRLAGLRSN